ncbi:hypothetical protein ACIOWK_32855 [Pseudomonas protegens]|uniref:hypothetical protein n=1 Tax=Pseudomonas protegens TaxID=380021 RepID=UPI003826D884
MRIIISSLCGCAQIKFYKGEKDVHAENFKGKSVSPYTRNIGELPEFDRHELSSLVHPLGWPEFTYKVSV